MTSGLLHVQHGQPHRPTQEPMGASTPCWSPGYVLCLCQRASLWVTSCSLRIITPGRRHGSFLLLQKIFNKNGSLQNRLQCRSCKVNIPALQEEGWWRSRAVSSIVEQLRPLTPNNGLKADISSQFCRKKSILLEKLIFICLWYDSGSHHVVQLALNSLGKAGLELAAILRAS